MELTKEVIQDIIKTEGENLLKGYISLKDYNDKMTALKADTNKEMQAAISKAVEDSEKKYETKLKEMGEAMQKLTEKTGNEHKTLFDVISAAKESLNVIKNGQRAEISLKDLVATSLTGRSGNRNDLDIDMIAKGFPFVQSMLTNRINMPADNEGFYVYYEQTLNTNNAATVAENSQVSQNVYTWEKKSIQSKEIKAYTKISMRQLFDMRFLSETVNQLLVEDWMLELEDQLINGLGAGNDWTGLLYYATEFDFASASKSVSPNLIDVMRKVKAQITKLGKNKFKPNKAFMVTDLVEEMAGAKDLMGSYLMPNWAMGGNITFSGVDIMENELANSNQILMGDFTKARLIMWDDMALEIFQEDDDASKGLVSLQVRGRGNLLVKTNDKNAIVKVTDYTAAKNGVAYVGA